MVMGHRTILKFDNFIPDLFGLDNGIGQGAPLSMMFYLYYNLDLLEVLGGKSKVC